jgi:hypothetical protein
VPDPAIAKVEDALQAVLEAWPALSGYTILTDQSEDIALEEGADKQIVISTMAYSFEVADENWMTAHRAIVDFEAINQQQTLGTINRANHTALALVIAALAADRSLGGRVQDIQERDVAPSNANGRDVGSASMQVHIDFFTPRGDHFTLVGPGGQHF